MLKIWEKDRIDGSGVLGGRGELRQVEGAQPAEGLRGRGESLRRETGDRARGTGGGDRGELYQEEGGGGHDSRLKELICSPQACDKLGHEWEPGGFLVA